MTLGSWGLDADGRFTVEYGGRTVITTDGTLICLLSTEKTYSPTVTFAGGTKDFAYVNRWFQSTAPVDQYHQESFGSTIFTRIPEETTQTTVLGAAPDGADIFVGQVRLNRTASPTHTWFNETVNTKPEVNVWIPWTGSGLIEAATGLARAMHLLIEGGNLVLKLQQSIATAAGGFGLRGDSIGRSPTGKLGLSVTFNSAPGFPVWTSASSPYTKQGSSDTTSSSALGAPLYNPYARTGSDPASTTDPTNYTSTYSVDVRGHFGRRS